MPWWSGYFFMAILCVKSGVIQSQPQKWPPSTVNKPFQPLNSNIDIQFDNEPIELISAGSGYGFPSDDEDFGISGSGSGSGYGDVDNDDEVKVTSTTTTTATTTTGPTTKRPSSHCEKEQQHNLQVFNKKMPDCLSNGDYAPVQCMKNIPGTGDCWCVDMNNKEIIGTRLEAPNVPSCEDGENLTPCVFELVKAFRPQRMGSFIPKCTVDGLYEKQQCFGSICYCVDEVNGTKIEGTEVNRSAQPICDVDETLISKEDVDHTTDFREETRVDSEEEDVTIDQGHINTDKKETEDTGKEGVFPDSDLDDNIDMDTDKDQDKDEKLDESNKTGSENEPEIKRHNSEGQRRTVETAGEIMTQPGILAGIIGGSVVLLLCLVLLIMFIIYRMRKKDEGSYPLDEPRRPANYAYVRTPDKEFYA